jgi:small subunit ribosomal protein S7
MPRKGPIPKREILPDPKYGNLKLAKFVNNLMVICKKKYGRKNYLFSFRRNIN